MKELIRTTRFRRDLRRVARRGKDIRKINDITDRLVAGEPLEARHRRHRLTGNWHPLWECHIEPDWLLIYKLDGDDIIFERTGTHADLFR